MSVKERRSASADSPARGEKRRPKGENSKSPGRDGRRLVKTKTPRVYRRVAADGRTTVGYVAIVDVAGKQRKKSARTYEAAKTLKREAETDRDRGEVIAETPTRIAFLRFLDEWIERYRGQGRRGFRPHTRKEYKRLIEAYAKVYFPKRLKLTEVSPYLLARFVDWLADEEAQGKALSDRTISNIVIPLKTALRTAEREGLIRHNPSQGLALPKREEIADEEEEDEQVKVFSREQLALVLSMVPEKHRLLFEILAGCGLRISEAVALQRLHFQLDDDRPEVCIRRAFVKGEMGPPKSKRGKRDVALSPSLARKVRARLEETSPGAKPTDFFFSTEGIVRSDGEYAGILSADNLRRRVLKPLVEEAGAPWAAFHTFRHTFASIHIKEGTDLVALSRVLGHADAALTLSRYTHLLPGEEAPPIDLDAVLPAAGISPEAELREIAGEVVA